MKANLIRKSFGNPPPLTSLRKRSRRQQLVADVLNELAVFLGRGAGRDPFGVGEECVPALLALGQPVPGKHVGQPLVALAYQRRPETGLADTVPLPDRQRAVLET